jgi:hypothetical protein
MTPLGIRVRPSEGTHMDNRWDTIHFTRFLSLAQWFRFFCESLDTKDGTLSRVEAANFLHRPLTTK